MNCIVSTKAITGYKDQGKRKPIIEDLMEYREVYIYFEKNIYYKEFPLMRELNKIKDKYNCNVLNQETMVKLQNDINNFLHFQHECGNIFYIDELPIKEHKQFSYLPGEKYFNLLRM
jgi:hypothetical protein